MRRTSVLIFALNLVACWSAPDADSESPDESSGQPLDEASASPPQDSPEPEPTVPLIQAVFPDSSHAVIDCVPVADGFVCVLDTEATSIVFVDNNGTTRSISGEESRDYAARRLVALSPSTVVVIAATADGDAQSTSIISRICAPWDSMTPLAIVDQPIVDVALSNTGLALLQGGNVDPQLAYIPADCASPLAALPLPEAQTVAAVAFDQSGSFVAVAGLRSRSLHVFAVQSDPPGLVAETQLELAIQPYVLASDGPSSWVIMGANSEAATTLSFATGEAVFGELTFPAPLHRLATNEQSWVGWSASEQALYVGDWVDTTAPLPMNGFPNLSSLALSPDGRVIGVDESGGFIVGESSGLIRDGLESVSNWVTGETQTWALSDQRLFELVP